MHRHCTSWAAIGILRARGVFFPLVNKHHTAADTLSDIELENIFIEGRECEFYSIARSPLHNKQKYLHVNQGETAKMATYSGACIILCIMLFSMLAAYFRISSRLIAHTRSATLRTPPDNWKFIVCLRLCAGREKMTTKYGRNRDSRFD